MSWPGSGCFDNIKAMEGDDSCCNIFWLLTYYCSTTTVFVHKEYGILLEANRVIFYRIKSTLHSLPILHTFIPHSFQGQITLFHRVNGFYVEY